MAKIIMPGRGRGKEEKLREKRGTTKTTRND
jgi:hypothetical protein